MVRGVLRWGAVLGGAVLLLRHADGDGDVYGGCVGNWWRWIADGKRYRFKYWTRERINGARRWLSGSIPIAIGKGADTWGGEGGTRRLGACLLPRVVAMMKLPLACRIDSAIQTKQTKLERMVRQAQRQEHQAAFWRLARADGCIGGRETQNISYMTAKDMALAAAQMVLLIVVAGMTARWSSASRYRQTKMF